MNCLRGAGTYMDVIPDPCDAPLRCAHAETLSASLRCGARCPTADPASDQYNACTRELSILFAAYVPTRKALPDTCRHHYPGGWNDRVRSSRGRLSAQRELQVTDFPTVSDFFGRRRPECPPTSCIGAHRACAT